MTAKPTRAVKVESERIAYPRLAAIVEAILIEQGDRIEALETQVAGMQR